MNITDGLWYIKTKYPPYYDVVSIMTCTIGPDVGKKGFTCDWTPTKITNPQFKCWMCCNG